MKQYKQFTLVDWLYHLENLHHQEIQLGLSRIKQVATKLSLLAPKATVITVAGTNGKGSTVAALEAIYRAAGYQVASYTSPHLFRVNERIRINQKNISDDDLSEAFCAIEDIREPVFLTYFEMLTLAALWHFKKYSIDVLILEVGLGGRLDATNIIDADLAIITTIDLDHQDFLGHDKEAIGYEKAGILRPKRPLIYADTTPPFSILEKAASLSSPLYINGLHYQYDFQKEILRICYKKWEVQLTNPKLHASSLAAAVMAAHCLKASLPVTSYHMAAALNNLSLPGRLQLIQGNYNLLLDVSHNSQGVNHLANFIKQLPRPQKIHAIFSALKDKDIPELIGPLINSVDFWYPAFLTGSRAATREQFDAAFRIYGIVPSYYSDPVLAHKAACKRASTGDLIVTYGSFLTVGCVLPTVDHTTRVGEKS
jgi:dihydrofolate synthase/folylpolyglutamate synthase